MVVNNGKQKMQYLSNSDLSKVNRKCKGTNDEQIGKNNSFSVSHNRAHSIITSSAAAVI